MTIDQRKPNRQSRWKRGSLLKRTCTTHPVLMFVTFAARSWHLSWKTRLLPSRWTDQLRRITINQTLFAPTSRPSSSWLSLSLMVVQTSKNTPTHHYFLPAHPCCTSSKKFLFLLHQIDQNTKLWEPFRKSTCKTLHLANSQLLWMSPLDTDTQITFMGQAFVSTFSAGWNNQFGSPNLFLPFVQEDSRG